MASPELSVVCKSCGSEVSPYVTECPYCGTRLRKRAPRLEREGDEIRVRESKREKRKRERSARSTQRRKRAPSRPRIGERPGERPWATILALAIPALLMVVQRAAGLFPSEVGALFGPAGDEPWRYLTAPFVYDDVGYLAVAGFAIGLFGMLVERRLGTVATALLILAAGTLGMLAAGGVYELEIGGALVAAGGNGFALGLFGAWLALTRGDRAAGDGSFDQIGAIVAGLVLLLLPFFEATADPIAGAGGLIVGYALGAIATSRTGNGD